MRRSGELPTVASPNSSRERRDKKGKVIQRRYYGSNGQAIINIDYDHDHGAGKPHAHDWDWDTRPASTFAGPRIEGK